MNIERISKLLNSFGGNSQIDKNVTVESVAVQAEEAVKFTAEFGRADASSDSSTDRAKRVAEIKQRVDAGTYAPDSTKVATALARELFV